MDATVKYVKAMTLYGGVRAWRALGKRGSKDLGASLLESEGKLA